MQVARDDTDVATCSRIVPHSLTEVRQAAV